MNTALKTFLKVSGIIIGLGCLVSLVGESDYESDYNDDIYDDDYDDYWDYLDYDIS